MTPLSAQDKLQLSAFLQSSSIALAKAQAALPFVEDDGLRKLVEASISGTEAQIKGVQEFCKSHGISQ